MFTGKTMNNSSFTKSPDNRYFEDYVAGSVHEFGPIAVEENEVLDFGKRFVPLSYHTDTEAAKKSIYGGFIASGWHTPPRLMRVFIHHYLLKNGHLRSPSCDMAAWGETQFS